MNTKANILFFLSLVFCMDCLGQKAGYNWFFGQKTGLNFNQSPPSVISGSEMVTNEGCSSISDESGNLLFYSNGITLYNRNNLPMKNSGSLNGSLSSTCNSVAMPMPGNDSLYYLFTVSAAGELFQTFSYSVINMKGDFGLGEVIRKNIYVNDPIFEKIAAVRHCNKRDVWVVVPLWGTDEYHAYLLSDTGLAKIPVISNMGLMMTGDEGNAIGALKFSADGSKLAAVHTGAINKVQLMNFNNFTGQLSNPITFDPTGVTASPGYRGIYGAEFSPDNRLLYISANVNPAVKSSLLQFNITTHTTAAISASKVTISQTGDFFAGALQAGPDQKIYFTMWKDSAISVINDPNISGPGCNFVYNAIRMNVGRNKEVLESGLPGFVASEMNPQYAAYSFSITRSSCVDPTAQFAISYTADIDSVKWDFGDGTQSFLLAPVHTYTATGTYDVQLIIFRTDCTGSHAITLKRSITYGNGTVLLPADISLCNANGLTIRSLVKSQYYQWNTGATADSITISAPGLYWLVAETNGCILRDSITIVQKNNLRVSLGNDTTVCIESPLILRPAIAGFNYQWNNGDTTPALTVTRPGTFWLQFENTLNCIYSDTLHITYGSCEIYFPSAFTPNGDGRNDVFGLINGTFTESYELIIFNRWGEIVYHTNDQLKKWDGTSKNKRQPSGVYAWLMRYKGKKGLQQNVKGTVFLIR